MKPAPFAYARARSVDEAVALLRWLAASLGYTALPGRDAVEAFNRRIVEARRQLRGGPPVITPTRDIDTETRRWRERRRARRSA